MKNDQTTFKMDKCIMLFVLLLVPYSTMSQVYITNLTSEGTIATITSPNYPDNYDNDADIYWRVIAPTGYRVMVQFNDFDLEPQGDDGTYYDILGVYHGLTNSFKDATQRALLSGSSLPDNISSIGSYLWFRFISDGRVTEKGFSLSIRPTKSDWACDFRKDLCGLIINRGIWAIGEWGNVYYILAKGNAASFTVPHIFTSREGTLSFAHWQSGNSGSLTVTVCQDSFLYGTTSSIVVYEYIPYLCDRTQGVQITFTATRPYSSISVLDIQLYESSILSTITTTLGREPSINTVKPTKSDPKMQTSNNTTLYIIVGSCTGVVYLAILVLVCYCCCCKSKSPNGYSKPNPNTPV